LERIIKNKHQNRNRNKMREIGWGEDGKQNKKIINIYKQK
jgi:hypothetical protein